MTIALLAGLVIVNGWLLILVHRQRVRKQLPWFALYAAWAFSLACIQFSSWVISPRFYVAAYWWMEIIAVVLIVGAVRESFLRIFQGFTSKAGFRWSVSGVIGVVVLHSAWKAIYAPPPPTGGRLAAFVIGSEFMFRWGIFGIALLTTIFSVLLKEPMDTREDAVVTGFGIASIAIVSSMAVVSFFGTRYLFFTQYAPSVGYFVAVFLWIRAFSRPVESIGFKDLDMEPEQMLKTIRGYRQDVKRIRRTK